MDATRIESKSLYLKEEKFNLNDVITNIVNDILATTTNRGYLKNEKNGAQIKLECYDPKNIFKQADKGRITQVVSNLLGNAIKFTKAGTISISLETKKQEDGEDHVVVSVKDTGQGIDPDIIAIQYND